jgi:hypothetical protein
MRLEEVNKTIAEYMGWEVLRMTNKTIVRKWQDGLAKDTKYFTESLDALVPVWEKLGIYGGFYTRSETFVIQTQEGYSRTTMEAEGATIQESAAIATAHIIKGLQNE